MRSAFVAVLLLAGCFYKRRSTSARPPASATSRPTRSTAATRSRCPRSPRTRTATRSTSSGASYACTDASDDHTDCDAFPFDSDTTEDTTFLVPSTRIDKPVPTLALRVILDASDEFGAAARPQQVLVIALSDHAPALQLSQSSAHDYVVGSHVALGVDVSDLDDDPTTDVVQWTVDTPVAERGVHADRPRDGRLRRRQRPRHLSQHAPDAGGRHVDRARHGDRSAAAGHREGLRARDRRRPAAVHHGAVAARVAVGVVPAVPADAVRGADRDRRPRRLSTVAGRRQRPRRRVVPLVDRAAGRERVHAARASPATACRSTRRRTRRATSCSCASRSTTASAATSRAAPAIRRAR